MADQKQRSPLTAKRLVEFLPQTMDKYLDTKLGDGQT